MLQELCLMLRFWHVRTAVNDPRAPTCRVGGVWVLAYLFGNLTGATEKQAEKFITDILRLRMNSKQRINSACLITRGTFLEGSS